MISALTPKQAFEKLKRPRPHANPQAWETSDPNTLDVTP